MAFVSAKPHALCSPKRKRSTDRLRPTCTGTSPTRQVNFFLDTPLHRSDPAHLPSNLTTLLSTGLHINRFLLLWRERPIVNSADSQPVFWHPSELSAKLSQLPSDSIYVPLSHTPSPNATQYFAVDVSNAEAPPTGSGQHVAPLRTLLPLLSEQDATLIAHAKSLLSWHANAQFCPRCGSKTHTIKANTARACGNQQCQTRNIYPRIMPSILALVIHRKSQKLLLGRKASWQKGRYSLLAGYAEIFESLEQTVVREVFEETKVDVHLPSVKYHSSQPWPSVNFASLMCGFVAYVEGDTLPDIHVDKTELEDAKWFEPEWLRENVSGAHFSIPGESSLASRMILEWLHCPTDPLFSAPPPLLDRL